MNELNQGEKTQVQTSIDKSRNCVKQRREIRKILTWIVFQTSMGVTEQGFCDVKGRWRDG